MRTLVVVALWVAGLAGAVQAAASWQTVDPSELDPSVHRFAPGYGPEMTALRLSDGDTECSVLVYTILPSQWGRERQVTVLRAVARQRVRGEPADPNGQRTHREDGDWSEAGLTFDLADPDSAAPGDPTRALYRRLCGPYLEALPDPGIRQVLERQMIRLSARGR